MTRQPQFYIKFDFVAANGARLDGTGQSSAPHDLDHNIGLAKALNEKLAAGSHWVIDELGNTVWPESGGKG